MTDLNSIQQCSRCIMDNVTDPFITFNQDGTCNHCSNILRNKQRYIYQGELSDAKLKTLVNQVKKNRKNSQYDCIIGISGGVDSSYLMVLAKQWGLKPLAVHMDNGWNSKIAVNNINKLLEKLEIELYTYVLNWEDFKDLQLSFFKASVIEVENPTDMAIHGALHRVANKFGIKYILNAGNYATEGISPKHFQYGKKDYSYTKAIHKKFGSTSLSKYPSFSIWDEFRFKFVNKIKILYPLNYVDYNKEEAKKMLMESYGWENYGGKHHESIMTKFVQGYYLYEKFKIDYRKATFSTMICNGKITREKALKEIVDLPYKEDEIDGDIRYIAKKFDVSEKIFKEILEREPKYYTDYNNSENFLQYIYGLYAKIFDKP